MQGESDSTDATLASDYETNLTNFINQARTDFGFTKFVLGRIHNTLPSGTYTEKATVRAAQDAVAAADSNVEIINTDTYGLKVDNIHFNASGQQSLGSAFASEF